MEQHEFSLRKSLVKADLRPDSRYRVADLQFRETDPQKDNWKTYCTLNKLNLKSKIHVIDKKVALTSEAFIQFKM